MKNIKFYNLKMRLTSIALLTTIGLTAIFTSSCSKKNKNELSSNNPTSISLSTFSLDDLGTELSPITENKLYGKTTGNVDKNKIVKDKNGTIWANKEALEKSSNIGKTIIDDKNGTLEQKEDGKVYQKEEYSVSHEDGTISNGTIDDNTKYTPDGVPIPDGYAWDPNRKEIVKEDEVGKYIYDENGDLVSIDTYNKYPHTPDNSETTNSTVEEIPIDNSKPSDSNNNTDVGIYNEDGTYTIFGITYPSKQDYEQFLINPEGYILIGEKVIYDPALYNEAEKQKTLK